MDEVAWHRAPPSTLPTLVTALSGWIDAGEAATDAMRFRVRHLAAVPLAAIDPEDFVDWTQLRFQTASQYDEHDYVVNALSIAEFSL